MAALTGNDLKSTNIAPGPHIKEILNILHEAKLDGRITTRQDEEALVNKWLASKK